MRGFRLADAREDELPDGFALGAYWRVLDPETGEPKVVRWEGKLTEECWRVVVPLGGGYGVANLDHHTVREHDDGTISVRPNDGSSNSILVSRGGTSWHGFIDHGVLEEC